MLAHPRDLLDYITQAKVAELGSDRVEVRLMSITIALMFFYQLGEPGTYILFIEDSATARVARVSHIAAPVIGMLFYMTACMLMPLLVALVFTPHALSCKMPRQLAAAAGIAGSALWILLAILARPLDMDWLSTVFLLRAAVDLGLGLLFGISLNAQHAKEAAERARRREEAAYEALDAG